MTYPAVSQQVTGGYYMANLVALARWLMTQGYSRAAAAGIAGTVAGESGGSPESVGSGGAGLIGWTPPSSAAPVTPIVTGNWQRDWDVQLQDLLRYADTNSAEAVARGGVSLTTLKQATDPVQAAEWWSAFEGPLVPGSDVRSSVATQVYDALAGVPETTAPASGATAATTAAGGTATTGFDITEPFKMAGTLLHDAAMVLNFFFAFFRPGQMWRVVFAIIAALAGAVAARLYAAGDTAANMPAIFALLGTMLIAGFMAFRGWPLSAASGQPIRPAAYVVDIAKGQIPPAQQLPDETTPIEWGLTVIFALWAVNKVAGLFGSSLGSLIGNLFGWLKDVFTAAPAVLPEAGLLSEQTASPAGLTVAAPDYSAASPGLASPGTAITGPGVVLA